MVDGFEKTSRAVGRAPSASCVAVAWRGVAWRGVGWGGSLGKGDGKYLFPEAGVHVRLLAALVYHGNEPIRNGL